MQCVDIGVFAHNEENAIADLLADLDCQTLVKDPNTELRIRILCNGCSDRTSEVAVHAVTNSTHLHPITVVNNFEAGGKALTWNRFVTELPDNSQFVLFIDGDIRIRDSATLSNLLEDLQRSDAVAATSRPIKDLRRIRWKPSLRMAAEFIVRQHKDGPISGQLYAVKSEAVRQIRLPVPCLVEDGFLSACLGTGLFSHPGQPERVKASLRASHYFETPGSLREFFEHDVRLSLGCEFNAALYSDLWAAETVKDRIALLSSFSQSSGIDRSLDEHERHPERSALNRKSILSGTWSSDRENMMMKLMKLAFRVLHSLYMESVRRRAMQLFKERRFQW